MQPNNHSNTSAPSLIDSFGRNISYLRLSVTDKCNLRCFYCMPKGFKDFEEPENWLTFEEIHRVIKAFSELGVARIRVTGGEPLVRKNLPRLIDQLNQLPGINDLSLSSNASLLSRYSQPLYDAGVSRLNISLDTLNEEKFKDVTGGGSLKEVLDGLQAAKASGFKPIKINMVAMKGINDHEISDMVRFCKKHDFILRLIETMPMGSTGKEASEHYLDLAPVRKQLQEEFDLIDSVVDGGGPARYMKFRNSDFHIGFITPISQHFCETCNRVRLSVDGTLYMCLGQEHSFELRPLLRNGISDDELKQAIKQAVDMKPERHFFTEDSEQPLRFMSMTGG